MRFNARIAWACLAIIAFVAPHMLTTGSEDAAIGFICGALAAAGYIGCSERPNGNQRLP